MSKRRQFTLFIGDRPLPLDLRWLAVDPSRPLLEGETGGLGFHFRYRDILLSVRFDSDGTKAVADIVGDIGTMPFSAESHLQRHSLVAIIADANAHLGPVFDVDNGLIRLKASLPLDNPVTAVGLVSALTLFLLPLKPYLETMAVVRLLSAGSARTALETRRPRAGRPA